MSNREKCNLLLDSFDEQQLANVVAMLQAAKELSDAADDEYCDRLYQNYLSDPEQGERIPLDSLCAELGVDL